ncbi:MAG: glycosyltransferase family 10 domain-containing protein [Alphaproteobacteria bacterium]
MPLPKGQFIIRNEGVGLPRALKRILVFAFPDYKIIYDDQATSPHLIITGYYGQPEEAIDQQHIRAPYFALSIENKSLRWRRFRATGYPFAELASRRKASENFIFFPFFTYAYSTLKNMLESADQIRKNAKIRRKQVAYIASDCTPEREGIFHALKKKLGNDQAIGMGKCSTTPGHKAPGGYGDLDNLLKDYNFVMAIENRNHKGYVTEKIINAYKVGAIPIYWGDAETVREFFNPDSFIDATAYKSFEELADAVDFLVRHPESLQKKLREPLFKDNKIHPLMLIEEENLTPEAEKVLREMAVQFRSLYNNYVDKKRKRSPYWKALDWTWESLS